MKHILSIFFITLFSSCTAQTIDERFTIKYEAITRGSFIEITYKADIITYKDTSSSKEVQLTKAQVNKIYQLLEKINYKELKNLIPPTTKSHSDAALQASLSITTHDKVYKTRFFDHGNPPKELKNLIEKIFEIVHLK